MGRRRNRGKRRIGEEEEGTVRKGMWKVKKREREKWRKRGGRGLGEEKWERGGKEEIGDGRGGGGNG